MKFIKVSNFRILEKSFERQKIIRELMQYLDNAKKQREITLKNEIWNDEIFSKKRFAKNFIIQKIDKKIFKRIWKMFCKFRLRSSLLFIYCSKKNEIKNRAHTSQRKKKFKKSRFDQNSAKYSKTKTW